MCLDPARLTQCFPCANALKVVHTSQRRGLVLESEETPEFWKYCGEAETVQFAHREPLRRVCNNLPWVDVLAAEGLNVYSILQRDYLAMTVPAIQQVVERLTRPIKR